MSVINAQKSRDIAEQDRVLREMEQRIQDQIRDLDAKISNLEVDKVENSSEIEKFRHQVSGLKQKNEQYLNNKAVEEKELKAQLDKTIKQKEDLVTATENDQENLLNNRALTEESIRRASEIIFHLMWLPEKAVRNQETFNTLSKNLDAYISTLLLIVDNMNDSIDYPGITASSEETIQWLSKKFPTQFIEDLEQQNFRIQDLLEIVQNEEDIKTELPHLTGFNVRRLKRDLDEVEKKEEGFKPEVNYHLGKFSTHVQNMLVWKTEADKAARELLLKKQESAKLISN